jgi:hypothetical protein
MRNGHDGRAGFRLYPHHERGPVNSGNTRIGSGNDVDKPISVLNICGTAIAILGFADVSCVGGAGDFGDFGDFSSTRVFP